MLKHNELIGNMDRHIKICFSFILIIIGGVIYLLYRDKSLVMFSWFEHIGLNRIIDSIRSKSIGAEPCYWIKYNLPAGLWLLSYMLIIDAVWQDCEGKSRKFYIYVLPILALWSELMQSYGLCSGTFDVLDVVSYLFAIILFKTIKYYEK